MRPGRKEGRKEGRNSSWSYVRLCQFWSAAESGAALTPAFSKCWWRAILRTLMSLVLLFEPQDKNEPLIRLSVIAPGRHCALYAWCWIGVQGCVFCAGARSLARPGKRRALRNRDSCGICPNVGSLWVISAIAISDWVTLKWKRMIDAVGASQPAVLIICVSLNIPKKFLDALCEPYGLESWAEYPEHASRQFYALAASRGTGPKALNETITQGQQMKYRLRRVTPCGGTAARGLR
ncbi:hypothetical protein FB451DRAFT_500358 [Mycena latifolia]|nr:hypothetical protein FB451DRAFT_500358 [Mycena latifolia]